MTHDDDDVTVPGDDEVIAALRRGDLAPNDTIDDSEDDVTLEADAAVIAEIRAAAAHAAEPEPEPTPLPPPQLGTLPPPHVTPVSQVPAATQPAGARWQPAGRLPVAQRVEPGRGAVPARIVRARWYLLLAVAAAALVIGAIFSLRSDGDDGPPPATTEVVTTTSP